MRLLGPVDAPLSRGGISVYGRVRLRAVGRKLKEYEIGGNSVGDGHDGL